MASLSLRNNPKSDFNYPLPNKIYSSKKTHLAKRNNRNYQRKEDPKDQFRTNEHIRVPEVRLVGDNLEDLSKLVGQTVESDIYPTRRVRDWADRMGLDVVEIAANAKPPVVRIIDYNKFLYEKKKKEKEIKAKAAKTVVKEIRFGPNTDDHDFEFKMRHARGFLEDGAKVKAYVHFRGRTIVFKDRGELLLLRFMKELEDVGAAEALPKMEGRRMIVIISPKKAKK
ncbi:MAG: translation initiation factor IF-3 [Lewinella sp.]|nr:translation initiation factor IF-3 [Lewinella sp.]